jgi:hypothetical protein
MFLPPPPNNSDDNRISEKPIPPANPHSKPTSNDGPVDPDVPQGEELFDHVLDCLNNGSSKAEVRKQLIAYGYSAEDAEQTVEDVADWRRKHPNAATSSTGPSIANTGGGDGSKNMLIGGLICLVGIVITVGTCLASSNSGGSITIAWGAIIFGGIQFFRGFSQSKSS